jgi:DNA polymerase-3 subunit beta
MITDSLLNLDTADVSELALSLTCKQTDLARALSLVSHAVLEKGTYPILANILVATDRNRLRLSATSLDLGIQVWLDAQIAQEGTTALPATLFTRMVSSLPQGVLTLSMKKGSQTLNLQGQGTNTNIRGVDPREFPIIPGIEGEQAAPILIEAGLLRTMVSQVAFAAGTDISKPVMTSVMMNINEALTLAAASDFRLVERVAPLPGTREPQAPVLIPARNLTELALILPSQGQVQVFITPERNQAVFHLEQGEQGEQIDIVFRLIEGRFPNYQAILPKSHSTRVVVSTKELMAALERTALYAVDSTKSARVTVEGPGDGRPFGSLTIEADDPDLGNHVDCVAAEVQGPPQKIFFHVLYMREALRHFDTPQVALELIGPGRPGILKPMADLNYTSLIQSMSVNTKA